MVENDVGGVDDDLIVLDFVSFGGVSVCYDSVVFLC